MMQPTFLQTLLTLGDKLLVFWSLVLKLQCSAFYVNESYFGVCCFGSHTHLMEIRQVLYT